MVEADINCWTRPESSAEPRAACAKRWRWREGARRWTNIGAIRWFG